MKQQWDSIVSTYWVDEVAARFYGDHHACLEFASGAQVPQARLLDTLITLGHKYTHTVNLNIFPNVLFSLYLNCATLFTLLMIKKRIPMDEPNKKQ